MRGEGGCGGQMVKQAFLMVPVLELQDGDFPTALYVCNIFSISAICTCIAGSQGKNVGDISSVFVLF